MTSAICLANVNIENVRKSEVSQKYKYDFEYPKITFKGKDLSLNKEIENITTQNINGLINDSKYNSHNEQYEGQSFYKDFENDFDVTSLLGLTYFYIGGNHGTTGLSSYNISNKTGKILNFNDIFKFGAKQYFEREIIKSIREDVKIKGNKSLYFTDMSSRTTDLDNAVVFFRGNYVIIRYQQYAIAPYSSGTPEFKFSKEVVKDYLKI